MPPTGFIKPRWQKLVMTDAGIDRRYELCAVRVEELLRSGDIWVQGSRRFKDFGLPGTAEVHQPQAVQRIAAGRGLDCEQYLHERLTLLEAQRHRQPHGGSQRPAGCHHHRVGLEDHAAGCGGARPPRRR
ncbi:hypothetical protein [Alcaligenes faecalis]|uniref:hypothetical protein n=1 Tax=Alcaligenes faecalis TaxID=511 RepID=UPI003B75B7C0